MLYFKHKNIQQTGKQLNEDGVSMFHWFGDKRLCIDFKEDKTKSRLSALI